MLPRRSSRLRDRLLTALALGASVSSAHCGPLFDPPREPPPPARSAPEAEVEANACPELPDNLPTSQLRDRTDKLLLRIARDAGEVRKKLAQANESQDAILSVCEDNRLSRLDALLRSVQAQRASLDQTLADLNASKQLASAPPDAVAVRLTNQRRALRVACERASEARAEADQCLGRPLHIEQQTRSAPLARGRRWG